MLSWTYVPTGTDRLARARQDPWRRPLVQNGDHAQERTSEQARRNAAAYMGGVNDAAAGRAFGRPDREYPTEEKRIAYRTGFYAELEMIGEDGEEG